MAARQVETSEAIPAQPAVVEKPRATRKDRGKLLVGAASLLPLTLWLSAGSLVRFGSAFSGLRQIAILAAYTGVTMMALNIALCARHPVIVRLVGGMGQLFKTHILVGKLAFSLVVLHGMLMVASIAVFSPLAGLSLLTPAAGWAVFAGIIAFSLLTVSVLGRIRGGAAGALHKLVGVAFVFASVHYLSVSGLKALSPLVAPYLAIMAAVGVTAYVYHLLVKPGGEKRGRVVKARPGATPIEEAAEIARRAEAGTSTR